MGMRCHLKSNTICYGFILAAFIFSVFISIANFAKLKGSLNIRVLQYAILLWLCLYGLFVVSDRSRDKVILFLPHLWHIAIKASFIN